MRKILSGAAAAFVLALGSVVAASPAHAAPECTADEATVTCVYTYSGAAETWTVPEGVTEITAEVFGAQGGSNGNFTTGGLGGKATSTLPVAPGEDLVITVGGAGGDGGGCGATAPAAGFNGGGNGTSSGCVAGGGGGGASDIRIGGSTLAERVLVAGGGGGSLNRSNKPDGPHHGGAGGGVIGGEGVPLGTAEGNGGDQDGGGSGVLGIGGSGAGLSGGGGGGYYGGAAGADGAGGGGSGYGPEGTAFETGVHAGDGEVIISYSNVSSSTLSLTASSSAVTVGDTVDLSALVASPDPDADLSGTVEFFAGEMSVGTAAVANGSAALPALELAVGTYAITAVYSGNGNTLGSAADPTTVAVAQATTTLALGATTNPVAQDEETVLTATVAGFEPTGNVNFLANGVSLGVVPLASGAASLPVSSLALGQHIITAEYSGDINNVSSTSATPLLLVVNAPQVTTPTPTPTPTTGESVVQELAATGGTDSNVIALLGAIVAGAGLTLLLARRRVFK